jgi:hypothetical protein
MTTKYEKQLTGTLLLSLNYSAFLKEWWWYLQMRTYNGTVVITSGEMPGFNDPGYVPWQFACDAASGWLDSIQSKLAAIRLDHKIADFEGG